MDQESYDDLVQAYGQDVIAEMVERLEEYADIDPRRFKKYANHATVIKSWLRRNNVRPGGKNAITEIQDFLKSTKMKEHIAALVKNRRATVGYDYIEFTNVRNGEGYIKFDNPRAKALIEHYVRKMK